MGTLYGRAPSRPRLLSRLGWRSKVAALVAIPALALAPQAATLVTSGSASAATAPPELPVAVTNNSGTADATYVYIIGHNTSTNQDGYIDGSGTFHAWSYPSSIPAGQPNPATPDFSIAGPGNGASEDIYLPQNIAGGRIYMSFGAKLQFFLTTNGLVQPAPWASGDPNQNTLFDWVEFTRSATGLDINTTMVDMFSVPFALSVTDTNGTTQSEGQLVSNGRANIFSQIAALGGSWPNLIYNDPTTGQPLRVIAPLHGIEASSFPSTFLDSYVSAVWSYYQSHTLTVSTGAATYTGTVSGSSFNFVDSTGAAIGSIAQPTTSQVFGCSGPLQPGGQPNETAILAVGAVVCAALNRGTLSTSSFAGSDTQPTSNASSFYTIATSNLYAKVMHQNSVDGKAYGFAFDDVAGFSTNINDGSTQSASITVSPFTGSTTTTTTAPSATTTTAPATTTTVAPQGYNNTGISADSNPGGANFDGGGWSYSATALANAGTSPGSTVASDGFNFTWPNVAAGSPDNWQAAGQTVSVGLPAGSSQLGILGAAGSASSSGSSGTATVNYSDGTSSTFTLLMPDWALGGGGDALPSGYTEAITSAYRNSSGGSQTLTMYVFATSVPINSAKTVTSVTLPSSVSSGNLHVFAFAGNGTGSTASCSGEGSAGADISADCFAASSGSPTVTATSDPSPSGVDANQVSQIANGVQLQYNGVNFGSGATQFVARVASGAASGVSGLVNVVLDNPSNAPIGSFAVGSTGGWSTWQSVPANITTTSGAHTVYLEFSSGQSAAYVSLHYFSFTGGTTTTAPAATTTTTAPATTTTTAPTTTTTTGTGANTSFNNTGISADSNPGGANFDGSGWSYSATALANAGVVPGSTVASDGFSFTWPNVAAGSPDNWQAAGQTVPLSIPAGSTQLGILGAAGAASSSGSSGTATVNYSDGTTSTFTMMMPDWALGGGGFSLPAGYTEAITSAYRNGSGGSQTLTMYVFATSVALNGSKTVVSVTLPSSVSSGNLHVFAFAGNGAAFNNTGISADSNPGGANFDGAGWSYSATALANAGVTPGSTVSSDGFNFTWPNVAAGSPDNWQAAGQTIGVTIPAGSANLGILGAAGNAPAAGSSGTATVNYTDGSSSTFTLMMPDWALGGGGDALPAGYTEAITSAYRNGSGGSQTLTMYVFATSVAIDPSKTVASVTLPSSVSGGNLHVFAFSGAGTAPATGGNLGTLGPNVYVFSPSEAQSTIQGDINTLYNAQVTNQFGSQRYALLFEPGTYGTASSPLTVNVGFYEEVAGLGQSPTATVINGVVNSYNQCSGTVCQATDNFWRSIYNLTINVSSAGAIDSCHNNNYDFWATSQDSPIRRVQVNGGLTLMDFCDNPGYASGGYMGDSEFNGSEVQNDSQQQFFVQNSNIDSWTNGVWNQVFCGDNGAPAQSFSANSGLSGGTQPYTTLATCGPTREEPYLYEDSSGGLDVFVPSVATAQVGPTWASGNTPGTSLPMSTFYVTTSSTTAEQVNAALAAGDNILFTPGVYNFDEALQVTNADTKLIGLGFPTIIPTNGTAAIDVADVAGVNISGMIIDAGPVNSPVLLQIGAQGSSANFSSDPVTVDDLNIRIGGAEVGSATTAMIDNSNYSLLDNVWLWRADHGAGGGSWTSDQSATGLIVNGNNVSAYGLAVEHFQQYETEWNGQAGTVVFFQNENPYEVPSQSAWMSSSTQDGYPAFYIPNSVTSFQGYGMGSYSYFDQGVAIENAMGFQAPSTSGVQFHDIFTRFLNGSGGIESVINGTGAAVNSSFNGPSDVVSYS